MDQRFRTLILRGAFCLLPQVQAGALFELEIFAHFIFTEHIANILCEYHFA